MKFIHQFRFGIEFAVVGIAERILGNGKPKIRMSHEVTHATSRDIISFVTIDIEKRILIFKHRNIISCRRQDITLLFIDFVNRSLSSSEGKM